MISTAYRQTKKGISAIVAVILILMMTVAASAVAFYWLTKIQGQLQGGTEQYQETTFERMASTANILNMDFNYTYQGGVGSSLRTIVQNVGTNDIEIMNRSADPNFRVILRDANQSLVCSTIIDGAGGDLNCSEGCNQLLSPTEVTTIVLYNMSEGRCSIFGYPNRSLFYVDFIFSGKATASAQFKK